MVPTGFRFIQSLGKFMQNATLSQPDSLQHSRAGRHYSEEAQRPIHSAPDYQLDYQFVALLEAYRYCSGLARANEVLVMLKSRDGANAQNLASWIVNRKLICFEWRSKLWLPLFQFDQLDMTPLPGLEQALTALSANFDCWEIADWFARPNAWLASETPADKLLTDPPAVLRAACAERFSVMG
jgi:hypothetical protein